MAKSTIRARDGLYRRENRNFAFRYKDADGHWREKYTGSTDRQQAREFKKAFLQQLDQATLPNDMAKWPLSSAIAYYLQTREAVLAPRTWKVHRSRCNSLIRTIGDRRLDQIGERALDTYQAERRKSGVSAEAVNKEIEILSYILRKAKLWKRLKEDYRPLPISRESRRRPLDVEDFLTLVQKGMSNPDWEAALMAAIVAANTACRSWEIKSLRIGDIDFSSSNPKLLVRRENTKSDAGAREIELNGLALWAITRLFERAATLGATQPHHYLFPADLSRHTKLNDPLKGQRGYDPTRHQQSWRSAWRNMTRAADLPHIHFHDLRHTAITRGREQGVDIGILKAIAGHMDARMVEYYSHIGSGVKRNAVDRIGETYRPVAQLLGLEEASHERVN
jgi:integrase